MELESMLSNPSYVFRICFFEAIFCFAQYIGVGESVVPLNSSNFEKTLIAHERAFIQWYAPWCAPCTALWPELTTAVGILGGQKMSTLIAKVDATAETTLASTHDIAGPALHYFVHGQLSTIYDGQQTAKAIADWLQSRERPEVSELRQEEEDEFIKEIDEDAFALIAHVRRKSTRHRIFLECLAQATDAFWGSHDIKFAVVWLSESANPKTDARLIMHRPGFKDPDPEHVEFEGAWSKKNIVSWVDRSGYPLLGNRLTKRYTPDAVQKLGWEGVVVLCPAEDPEDDVEDGHVPAENQVLHALAREHSKLKFTVCDLNSLSSDEREQLLGERDATRHSAFISVLLGAKKRYVFEESNKLVDGAAVQKFLADARTGKLTPRYKSELRPALEPTGDNITVLVGNSFDTLIKDPNKDYFVDFTHPRCEHCKDLDPIWVQLAQEVHRRGWYQKGVVIARMDMSKNDCEEEVPSYPKLVLYPAVSAKRKMKAKQVYTPARVQALKDFPISKFIDFLMSNAVNLEGVEEAALEAEIVKGTNKRKTKKRQRHDL